MPIPTIAIIGAGFSGTLLAVQLARRSMHPLHIMLYDERGAFARGVAYGTREPRHLLNVRADRMGAFPDAPGDFHRWLTVNERDWRERYPAMAGLTLSGEAFMPRMLYGDYLESLFQEARANAKGVRIETVTAQVTDALVEKDSVTLSLADGGQVRADRLVLALGSLGAESHGLSEAALNSPRYTGTIWQPPQGSLLTRRAFTAQDSPVLIVGSGLTTIDAIASLKAKSYTGDIVVVSRHGLWPRPHARKEVLYPAFIMPQTAPETARELVRVIHAHARKAGAHWHGVIDALRKDTPAIWAGLGETERRKLLRALSFWNVSRHRMPPSSHALLVDLAQTGQLTVKAGRIEGVAIQDKHLQVRLRPAAGEMQSLAVAHVLNTAGPQMRIDRASHPLLGQLLKRGAIQKGPLGLGLAADALGNVKNGLPPLLFALGPLLVGERLETVAVPELRQQAELLAQTILVSLP